MAYLIDDDGHIKSSRQFEAADDVRAINHARQWVDGRDVEVWQLDRMLAKLKRHKDKKRGLELIWPNKKW